MAQPKIRYPNYKYKSIPQPCEYNFAYSFTMSQGDYLRKIHEKILAFERRIRTGTSANGANTPDPGL